MVVVAFLAVYVLSFFWVERGQTGESEGLSFPRLCAVQNEARVGFTSWPYFTMDGVTVYIVHMAPEFPSFHPWAEPALWSQAMMRRIVGRSGSIARAGSPTKIGWLLTKKKTLEGILPRGGGAAGAGIPVKKKTRSLGNKNRRGQQAARSKK